MDLVLLSRIQFALNISFHYLFPPLSIGLSFLLVIMESFYVWKKDPLFLRLARFWTKIFALIFAIGIASGLVMVFAFGNTFSHFSRFVGDVFGSLLSAEGIFAFFLESGFMGVVLFGWHRVSKALHLFSTCMVALGAHFSAFWIVMANSWMQTPSGFKLVEDEGLSHAVITNFSEALFNPSGLIRFWHVLLGCWLAGAFLVISVSAFYLLKKREVNSAKMGLKIAFPFAAISLLLQLLSGDSSAREVARDQPIKLAAFEAVFHTIPSTPLYIGGIVDTEARTVYGIDIPAMLSLLVHRSPSTPVEGLDHFKESQTPNVAIVFQTYHGMVLLWFLMAFALLWALWSFWRKNFYDNRKMLWFLVLSVVFPQLANQLGWFSSEMGRQPWAVYGQLTTKAAITPALTETHLLTSLTLFSAIYLLLFILFITLLDRRIRHGFEDESMPLFRDRLGEK